MLGSVGEDTKKATRGRTRGVVGRLTTLTLGITPDRGSADGDAVTGGSASRTATEARRLEKARYAPEVLGKRARKDGVAKRRAQDEDKKHSEGETQKPDGERAHERA